MSDASVNQPVNKTTQPLSTCPVHVAGTRSFAEILAYCVAKSAVDQMTRCAALELSTEGVRVNSVNPGAIVTIGICEATRFHFESDVPIRFESYGPIRKFRIAARLPRLPSYHKQHSLSNDKFQSFRHCYWDLY